MLLILAQDTWDWSFLVSIEILAPALMALGVARNPDGVADDIAKAVDRVRRRFGSNGPDARADPAMAATAVREG